MLEEIILNVILFGFVYWLGFRMGTRWILIKLAKFVVDRRADLPQILKELDADLARAEAEESRPEGVPSTAQEINVEYEQNTYYLYRKTNNEFLGQGPTLREALDSVKKRFPDESFWGTVERELVDKWGLKKEVERQNT